MAKQQKKTQRKRRQQQRRRSQRGGGNGYSVSVEDGSIAGRAVYTGYDSRAAPLFVGGITNEVNAMPMVPGPASGNLPEVTRGYAYPVMSSEPSGSLTGAPLAELGRQSGGGKYTELDKEVAELIEQFRNVKRTLRK
jgi:hypothetical protein